MCGEVINRDRTGSVSDIDARAATVKAGIPRPIEVVISLLGLAATAPLLALSALGIAVTSPGPVFFRQQRVGLKGRTFTLYKLRTMRWRQTNGPQLTASGDRRITCFGRILRRTKLDELPQLWNVLKGEMSLVGPRPEVPRYVNLENPIWRLVLDARPGITDPVTLRLRDEERLLAAVTGDQEIFYLETLQPFKLKEYFLYLTRRTWLEDVKVLGKTGLAILLPAQAAAVTLEEISSCLNSVNHNGHR